MVEDGAQAHHALAIGRHYEARDFSGLLEETRALHDRFGDTLEPPVRQAVASMLRNASCVAMDQGPRDRDLDLAECAVRFDPASRHALGQRMYAHLSRGDYAAAWAWECWSPAFRDSPRTMWRGERTDILLVINSNGLGDFIQYSRFLPEARRRVDRLIVQVPPNTMALFAQSPLFQGIELVEQGAGVSCRAICELMLLPVMIGAGRPAVTVTGTYLQAPPWRLKQWRALIDGYAEEDRRLSVGVVWGGRGRPNPDPTLRPADPAVRPARRPVLRSAEPRRQGRDLRPRPARQLHRHGGVRRGEPSCLCRCMDIVIAPDMGIAHLSAALGGETWLALPHLAEWRWGTEGGRTDWYPTMRLFRQPEPGDWDGVIAAMVRLLAERTQGKALEDREPLG